MQFALTLYTKSRFGAVFMLTCVLKMSRSVVTVSPISMKMVLKVAEDLKEKSQRAACSKNFARQNDRELRRGGGAEAPPPGLVRVKV